VFLTLFQHKKRDGARDRTRPSWTMW